MVGHLQWPSAFEQKGVVSLDFGKFLFLGSFFNRSGGSENLLLVGGFKDFLFSPWGRFPILTRSYFSDGLVQPPTRFLLNEGKCLSAFFGDHSPPFFFPNCW